MSLEESDKHKKALQGRAFLGNLNWGERRGSNPRQPESQSGTLPTELRPPQKQNSIMFAHLS